MERVAGAATRGADPLRGCDRGPVFGRGGGGGGGGGGGEAEEGCRCKSNRRARPRCREKQKTLPGGRFGVTAGRQWEGRCRRRGEEGLAGRGMFGRSSCRERRRTSHSLSLALTLSVRLAGWRELCFLGRQRGSGWRMWAASGSGFVAQRTRASTQSRLDSRGG